MWVRALVTIGIALIIGFSLLFFATDHCPPGETWVLSDSKWVCTSATSRVFKDDAP